jgi:hypothetical protein
LLPFFLVVSQSGQAIGSATYGRPVTRRRHTFTLRVEASERVFQAGIAQALRLPTSNTRGQSFSGIDDGGALEIVS